MTNTLATKMLSGIAGCSGLPSICVGATSPYVGARHRRARQRSRHRNARPWLLDHGRHRLAAADRCARGHAPLRAVDRDPRARRHVHRHADAEGRADREQSTERRDDRLRARRAREEARRASDLRCAQRVGAPLFEKDALPDLDPTKATYAPEWIPRATPLKTTAGMHRFVWPLRYAKPAALAEVPTPTSTACGRRRGNTRSSSSSTASACASR